MSTRDNFRVIEILNKHELLINYGSNQGAKEGQRVIISITGEEVRDPLTNKLLGTLDIIKGDLEIYSVYPNFSICRDITYEERNIMMPLGMKSKTIQHINRLNVSDEDISGRWPKSIPAIKVGDVVTIL